MIATNGKPTTNGKEQSMFSRLVPQMVHNLFLARKDFLKQTLDAEGRDLNAECGYPDQITKEMYRQLYDRNGIATRVVRLYPEECWETDPEVYEVEESDDTEFETAWKDLGKNLIGESWLQGVSDEGNPIWHYLQRADELSGIGHFGIILLGLSDGKKLSDPAPGIDEKGLRTKARPKEVKLLFLRALDESLVEISEYERDEANPRYGLPKFYNITLASREEGPTAPSQTQTKVHWSRIIHIADNCKASEVFGMPRLQNVYDRILDLRKMYGGSAEMFWKGAFPGLSFEMNPDALETSEIDREEVREEFERYQNGLQRYLAVTGLQAKSLAPQVASPVDHITVQLQAIAITIDVPLRVFMGAEEAKLASTQDAKQWSRRLKKRRTKYITPRIVQPFVNRLIMVGVLPEPQQYFVAWQDLDTPTDLDKADVAVRLTQALAAYISGGVDTIIPPMEFLTHVLKYSTEEATAILEAATDRMDQAELDPLQQKAEEEKQLQQEQMKQEQDAALQLKKTAPPGKIPSKRG